MKEYKRKKEGRCPKIIMGKGGRKSRRKENG